MPEPLKLISGRVSPLVGNNPMFTPMLMKAWTPIQMPMPIATRAGYSRPSATAWRPMTKARWISRPNSATTISTPTSPSSSAITASRKSVCASGR